MSFGESVSELVEKDETGLLGKAAHWERVRLGEVASIRNGFAFPSAQFSSDGGVPLIRIRDIHNTVTEVGFEGDFDAQYIVEPGDLVVGMDGDFSAALWSGPTALLNQRVCRISTDADVYNLRFLYYLLPGYLQAIHAHTSAVTVKHLSSRTLAKIPLPLPALSEQCRVVDKIEELFSELDAGVEALERAETKMERYRASVLKAAVEGRLTQAWRAENPPEDEGEELLERILAERRRRWEEEQLAKFEAKGKKPPKNWEDRYKEPGEPDMSGLPELSDGWCWASIDHLAYDMSNGRSVRTKTGGFPVLRLTAIEGWTLDLSERKQGDWTRTDAERFLVQENDFFIARGNGSLDLVGRGARAVEPVDEVAFPDTMIRIKACKDVVKIPYLAVAWDCSFVRRQLESAARTTAGIYKVNQQDIRQVLLPVPPPAEQDELTSKLEVGFSLLDALETTRSASAAKSEVLRQSILKKAFEGRLVPQDCEEERASALLERIQSKEDDEQSGRRSSRKEQSSQPELDL